MLCGSTFPNSIGYCHKIARNANREGCSGFPVCGCIGNQAGRALRRVETAGKKQIVFGGMNLACNRHGMILSGEMRHVNAFKIILSIGVLALMSTLAGGAEIHEAAKAGLVDVAEALISADSARVNEAASGGITPLHLAAVYGQTDMAAFLITRGAAIEAQMDAGFSPLHCAVMKEHVETVRLLVAKGANVKAATRGGLTSLHIAVQKGNMAILGMLLDAGADVRAKTKDGATALEWAAERNAVEMVGVLADALKRQSGDAAAEKPAVTGPAGADAAVPVAAPDPATQGPAQPAIEEKVERLPEPARGVIRFDDGAVYDGDLLKGRMHGVGVLVFPDGEKYEGQWIEGEKQGEGKATFPNGEEYDGQWARNKKHGRGKYSFPGGDRYEGQWVEDRMHGSGVYTFSDGTKLEGQWEENWFVTRLGELPAGTK